MIKRNVYLMQIQNEISGKYFLPLSLGYLWSYIESQSDLNQSYRLADVFMFRDKFETNLSSLTEPSIVGISTYIWNWEISKEFARRVKQLWPNCKVIMGGPQVQYSPSSFEELPFVDFIVSYEGEHQFAEILRENLKDKPDFLSIAGLFSREQIEHKKRTPHKCLDDFPSPYLNGFFDSLLLIKPGQFNMIMETNRGCPYTCSFCDMQDSYYNKIRVFDLDRVKKELEWAAVHKIEFIECADSNFGIFARDREIVEHLVALRRKHGYPRSFNFTSAKNQPVIVEKIQEILIREGLQRGISISLQSFNPDTLKAIKRWNSTKADLTQKIERYQAMGYESYIELILGLPGETKDSWMGGICEVLESGYTGSLLIHPLSVVPNTPFSKPEYQRRYGLKYTSTRSPAQGFCFGTESPEEREMICYESHSMAFEDWLDCYIFGKIIVGSYYFHGLLYFVCQYLKSEHQYPLSRFFKDLLEYVKASDRFLGNEYRDISQALRQTLFSLRPWGRKVFGTDDMYWSDQAAGAMKGIHHYEEFQRDVIQFILEQLPHVDLDMLQDLFRFNYEALELPINSRLTSDQFSYNWHEHFTQNADLQKIARTYQFKRKGFKDRKEHALDTYWYGRKSRRCFVKEIAYADL
jgi:radical SAM superfamily enzyme YgiQ (UPF0313 family)